MARPDFGDVALLDVLRPPAGYETDAAWLGTYSADLVAVLACLIALAGEDGGSDPPPTAMATAITRLTHRVRVVAQAGRVKVPDASSGALRMADRWIREAHFDGRSASWHPKVVLVRQVASEGVRWVLWLGSRNLTQDVSWDLGLAVVGLAHGAPRPIPGLSDVARTLATHAELEGWDADRLAADIALVRWDTAGEHITLESLILHGAGSPSVLPECPADATHLLAVSPFLDRTTLKAFQAWGPAKATRQLATTPGALRKIALAGTGPLKGLSLRSMQAATEAPPTDPDDDEQQEEVHRGLHAKALLAGSADGKRATLWMGSANLTRRAWLGGHNVELTARLSVSRALAELIWQFTDSSLFCSEHDYLKDLKPEDDEEEPPLDSLRNLIAGWDLPTLRAAPSQLTLKFGGALPAEPACQASVGLLGGPTESWQVGTDTVVMPLPPVKDWTEMVCVTLTTPEHTEQFMLRGSWVGGIPEERDHKAISSLLGASAFLRWLVASLQGVPLVSGGKRSRRSGKGGKGIAAALDLVVPSLEAILRTWTRHPERLERIDRRLRELAAHVRSAEQDAEVPNEEALRLLETFEAQWTVLRQGLWGVSS